MNEAGFSGQPNYAEEDRTAKVKYQTSLLSVLLLLVGPWTVNFLEAAFGIALQSYGLYPRTVEGLLGLVSMPFLHEDFDHLSRNSFGLLILGLSTFYFFSRVAWRVILYSVLATGAMVWLFGRPSYHIGASGLVYTLSAFLFLSGCLRRDRASRGSALIVGLLYGGTVWGIFPLQEGTSWEGHLFGALSGIVLAIRYRRVDLPLEPAEEDDESIEFRPPEEDAVSEGRILLFPHSPSGTAHGAAGDSDAVSRTAAWAEAGRREEDADDLDSVDQDDEPRRWRKL